jgi:hypothetical protein
MQNRYKALAPPCLFNNFWGYSGKGDQQEYVPLTLPSRQRRCEVKYSGSIFKQRMCELFTFHCLFNYFWGYPSKE